MTRFLKDSATEGIRARHPNRPATGRELLALLGCELDVDPAQLLRLKDTFANDWTLTGATFEATGASQGVTNMALDVVLLDALNEEGYVDLTGLPQGAYMLRAYAKDSAQVADDLGVKVRNVTDAGDILAEVTKTMTGAYKIHTALFSVRAADVGDTMRAMFTKKTGTANSIRIDYIAIVPLSAVKLAWGQVPDDGRFQVLTWNADDQPLTSAIYDHPTAGNVVESQAYTYASAVLTTLVRVREGRTRTESYTYNTGRLETMTPVVT